MSKQIKYIIITAACVLLLIAGVLIVTNLPGKEPETVTPAADQISLIDLKNEDIASLEIVNQFGTMKILPLKDSTDFYIDGYEDLPIAPSPVYNLVTVATSFTSIAEVDKPDTDLSTYGLSEPTATITVTAKEGSPTTFVVGDQTPLGNGYYGYIKGNQAIYVLKPTLEKLLSANVLDFIEKELIPKIEANSILNIKEITLGGSARNEEVVISKRADEDEKSTLMYSVTKPKKHEVDSTFLSTTLIDSFNGLTADSVVVANATDADKTEYGIADAPFTFQWITVDQTVKLVFGNTDGDSIYVMNPDLVSIYKVKIEKVKAVMAPLEDINSKFVAMRYIDTVDTFSLTADGKTYDFKLEGDIDSSNMTASYKGKEIDLEKVRNIYSSVIGMKYAGDAEPTTEKPVLTVIFYLRDGDKTQTLEFFEIDARKCYIKLDGEDTGSYVYKKEIDSVISDLNTLIAEIEK